MTQTYTLGTRGSKLARIQTDQVRKELRKVAPDLDVRTVIKETSGDRFADQSIHALSGKGFFTKDLDQAVVSSEIDAAVHSAKDVPTEHVPDLTIGAFLEREAPGDVLVTREPHSDLERLPDGARVGTSSLRRQALALDRNPALDVQPIRGNVDTRLEKLLDHEEVDALILAEAGLRRLERTDVVTKFLNPETFYPAPGQGAILIQCRTEETELTDALNRINDEMTETQVHAERAVIEGLEGGCRIPLGAYCTHRSDEQYDVYGMVASIDGTTLLTASSSFNGKENWNSAAQDIVSTLKQQGAESLISDARQYLKRQENSS